MRNLKRALSLGLTAAMISGLMVMGSSAASYADVTSEDHEEAIAVLQAVGVMVGDENGDFNPDSLVTRNEMAVVMSNLMEYNVATYAGTSPFTDVPAWAEPYVAACWTNGITAGTSATTYGGSQNVTTAQAALMLMKALGYFQYSSDFGGDWQLATVTQGNKIDLFHDVDANVRDAMTRNELAQLVLNTLESGVVEATNDSTITVGDVSIVSGVEYRYVTSESRYASAIKDDSPAYSATSISTRGYIVELGEKLYDGDLRRTENTTDAYGRPGTQWVYKLNEVGTYADEPLAVYTSKVSKGDLYSLVSKARLDDISRNTSAADGYTFTVYSDGEEIVGGVYDSAFDAVRSTYFSSNSSAAAGTKGTNAIAGKGVVTEVYLDNDGNLTLVYINTYLMQATADYNANKDTLSVDVITNPSDYDRTQNVVNVNQLNGDDFDIADYDEDDYILYTVADGQVEDIYPAQVVTGEVTAYSVNSYVTLDSTKYEYAAKMDGKGNDPVTDSAATEYRVGDTAAVVVDQYGYALYVDSAAISLGNYLFVDAVITSTGFGGDYLARVYFTDGTKSNVTLNNVRDKAGNDIGSDSDWDDITASENTSDDAFLRGWYSYSVNSSDKYNLTAAESDSSVSVSALEGDKVQFATGVRGNSSTVLIVDDGDNVKVYTGISNFPEIKGNITVNYFKESDDNAKTYAAAAFVDASDDSVKVNDGSTDTMLYVLDRTSSYVDNADNETVYVYDAILDGVMTTIESKDRVNGLPILYTEARVDSDGYYELSDMETFAQKNGANDEYFADDLTYVTANDTSSVVSVSGSSMYLGGENFVLTDDTQINVVVMPATGADAAMDDIMDDADADYEVYSVTGRNLNSMLGDYGLEGEWYVVTEDDDSEVAVVVYILVTNAVEM